MNKKIENQKVKKYNKKKTSSLKHRLDRSVKVEGVLSHKIQESLKRAKYVQNARKSGWEQINKNIDIQNNLSEFEIAETEKTQEQLDQEDEDAYVADVFSNDNKSNDVNNDNKSQNENKNYINKFALLEEIDA